MATDDVRQLVDLIAFLRRHDGATVAEVARLLGVDAERVDELLDRILMCGVPPYSPRDYVSVFREEGRIRVQFADHFRRPVDFSAAERACLMVLLDEPTVGETDASRDARLRLRDRIATPAGGDAPADSPIHVGRPGTLARQHANTLQTAINADRRVRLLHFSSTRFQLLERIVDPFRLVRIGQTLYLVARDRTLRGELVRFRVDRIAEATQLDDPREPADESEIEAQVDRARTPKGSTGRSAQMMRLRVGPRIAPYIREVYEARRVTDRPDGSIELRMPLVNGEWAIRFALSLGEDVDVLDPPELRERMRELVDQMLAEG